MEGFLFLVKYGFSGFRNKHKLSEFGIWNLEFGIWIKQCHPIVMRVSWQHHILTQMTLGYNEFVHLDDKIFKDETDITIHR